MLRPLEVALPATVIAALSLTQIGPAAAQSDNTAVRVIGITKLDTSRTVVNTLAINCVRAKTNNFVDWH